MATATKSDVQLKLTAANQALQYFAPGTQLVARPNGWHVEWQQLDKSRIIRRWQTRKGSHYPVWYSKWCHGGTVTLALSQLIRWLRDETVLPISSWQYWCGDRLRMGREHGADIVAVLSAAGWPESVLCVLCGKQIAVAGDWYSLEHVEGPSCSMSRCDLPIPRPGTV